MTDIADLIERLERATGADYTLSREIGDALGMAERYEHPGSQNSSHRNYTGSVDAALTLRPEGFEAYVATGVAVGYAHACVWTDHHPRISGGARAVATPAIALCIAALKVRQHTSAMLSGGEK